MDAEDDEEDETLANMPRLSVKVQHDVEENFPGEELQDEEHEGEEQDQPMEGVSSQKGEETQEPGYSEQTERPELPEAHSAQDRYGNYIMSQFSRKDFIKLRQWTFNLNFAIPLQNELITQLCHRLLRTSTLLLLLCFQKSLPKNHIQVL